jgi:putative transposase
MGRPKKQREPLPPIWEASDALWEIVEPLLLDLDPPAATGRKRIDQRAAFDAIVFRLRTGCQWNHLPKEYPDDSSVHRTFQRWVARGIFPRLWATVQERCEDLGGCDWEWQAADTAMGKARGAPAAAGPGTGSVPIPLTVRKTA